MNAEELTNSLASARLQIKKDTAKFHPLAERIASEWEDVPSLIQLLTTTEHRATRIILIQALGKIGDKRAVEPLVNSIQGNTTILYFDEETFHSQQISGWWQVRLINGQMRRYDLAALTTIEDSLVAIGTDSVPALLVYLHNDAIWDNNESDEFDKGKKRTRIIQLLGRIGDERAVETLLEIVRQMPPNTSTWDTITLNRLWLGQEAKKSLVILGGNAIPALLRDVAETKDVYYQRHCIDILGEIGDHRAIPILLDLYSSVPPGVQLSIEEALGSFKDDRVANFLLERLQEATHDGNIGTAIRSLGRIGDQRATPAILSKWHELRLEDWSYDLEALKNLADPRTIPLLESVIFSDKFPVNTHNRLDYARRIAVRALAEIDDPAVNPILVRATKSANRGVRSWARKALKKRGNSG